MLDIEKIIQTPLSIGVFKERKNVINELSKEQ